MRIQNIVSILLHVIVVLAIIEFSDAKISNTTRQIVDRLKEIRKPVRKPVVKPVGKPHHLNVGSRHQGDALLATKHVNLNWQLLAFVSETLTFNGNNDYYITRIEAKDQATNGQGARASITEGGIGHQSVTMKFRSGFCRGIDFIVKIYGMRRK